MTLLPARSTLFPYTTLFRSAITRPRRERPRSPRSPSPGEPAEGERGERGRDRKSTRLNSRHMSISYAIFREKKKKVGSCVDVNATPIDHLLQRRGARYAEHD